MTLDATMKNFQNNWITHPAMVIWGFSGLAHRLDCSKLTRDHDRDTSEIKIDEIWQNAGMSNDKVLMNLLTQIRTQFAIDDMLQADAISTLC